MSSKQELISRSQQTGDLIQDIQNTKTLADTLIRTKHYQQLEPDGILAVIQKAKSLSIDGIVITPHTILQTKGALNTILPTGACRNPNHQLDSREANKFLESKLSGIKRIPFENALHSSTMQRLIMFKHTSEILAI